MSTESAQNNRSFHGNGCIAAVVNEMGGTARQWCLSWAATRASISSHGADDQGMGGFIHLTDGVLFVRRQLHAGRAGEEVVRDGHQDAGAVACQGIEKCVGINMWVNTPMGSMAEERGVRKVNEEQSVTLLPQKATVASGYLADTCEGRGSRGGQPR